MNNTHGRDTAFTDHIIAFSRALRRLGFRISPDHITSALQAVQAVGVSRKDDVRSALKATLVHNKEELDLFDQAFQLFWKAPSQIPEMMKWLLQTTQIPNSVNSKGYNRVQDALQEKQPSTSANPRTDPEKEVEVEIDEIVTYSPSEVLRKKDFAAFTNEEIAEAKRYMTSLKWPVPPYPSRRMLSALRGNTLDIRKTTRGGLKHGGEFLQLNQKAPRHKMRPLVVLCDISGSMERYARMLLHFMYAVVQNQQRVESFVFGTRLTRITPYLKYKDVDEALDAVSKRVFDWSGGTKIGESIKAYNYNWLRRTLRSSSIVLVISDGWDRGDTEVLHAEMNRLSKKLSCRRLIWLNPLMGFDGYEPLTNNVHVPGNACRQLSPLKCPLYSPKLDDLLPVQFSPKDISTHSNSSEISSPHCAE